MYIARVDMDVLRSKEVQDLLDQYEEKFGKRFTAFAYGPFHSDGEKCAAEVWKEALIKALNAEPASACADENAL